MLGTVVILLCAFCHRPVEPGAPTRKSAGATYHPGCFDRKDRASLEPRPLGDPPALRKLLNARTKDGTLLCPDCRQPIPPKMGAQFRDGYAVHLQCDGDRPQ